MALPKESVTMRTIAEEVGVTLTTVSRILNNKGGKYAEKTKKKIFEVADRLKYRPNALVLGMQTGKTKTAGVMIPASEFFYSQIISGIHEVFLNNETIMLLSWNYDILKKEDEVMERSIIHQLVDRRVDGIILRPSSEEFERSYFEEIWERKIPLILVDREMAKVKTDFVGTDDEAGGQAAAEYLISLGHRNILFVGASNRVSTSRYREDGFRRVLSESPNACGRSIDIADAAGKLPHILKEKNCPTAIFCYNDPLAEKIIPIIQESGLSVPNDISIIGFGNEPSGSCPVPLTTFDQYPQKIGKVAAQMYLDRVNSATDNGTRRELIKPDLIVRASCKMQK
jgi:LacI family transcriptional regulator